MQNDTKHKKKKAPIICAAIVIGLLAAYLAVILFALIGEAHGELFALIFLLLYGGLIVAVVFGVIAALRQRNGGPVQKFWQGLHGRYEDSGRR